MDTSGNIYKIPNQEQLDALLKEKFITELSPEEHEAVKDIPKQQRVEYIRENRAMRRERERRERREAKRRR